MRRINRTQELELLFYDITVRPLWQAFSLVYFPKFSKLVHSYLVGVTFVMSGAGQVVTMGTVHAP